MGKLFGGYSADSSPTDTDYVASVDSETGLNKKILLSVLRSLLLKVSTIWDTNGNESIRVAATGSAVNDITVTNAATTVNPSISATGDDTNIGLKLVGKGTGKVYNDSPAAGSDYVATSEATTSSSFTDLATSGPAVTVVVGASGMLWVAIARFGDSATVGARPTMGFALSGANTLAAANKYAIFHSVASSASQGQMGGMWLLTGLTPGSTTVTAKYKNDAGTNSVTISARHIAAWAV